MNSPTKSKVKDRVDDKSAGSSLVSENFTALVSGYSASSGAIHSIVAAPVTATGMLERRLCSRGSRPILQLLDGMRGWGPTKALIAAEYAPAGGGAPSRMPCGLIIPDPAQPRESFAVRLPLMGAAVPAVRLGATGGRWTAEACVLRADGLHGLTAVEFLSASVVALLTMAEDAFARILNDSAMADSRLTYLRATGELFIPDQPDTRKWTIACVWPDWQERRLSFPARSRDLSLIEGRLEVGGENLRQMCFRMDLIKRDTTDM